MALGCFFQFDFVLRTLNYEKKGSDVQFGRQVFADIRAGFGRGWECPGSALPDGFGSC